MSHAKCPVVLILGAGAVGLSLAGKMAGVADVYAACRPRHAAAIREHGLVMEGIWGNLSVMGISCVSGRADVPPDPDYILITAKGPDTQAICEEYAGVIREHPVATLQNGIGNEEIIARYTGVVIGGTVTTNFSVIGDGHVRVKSESSPMVFGLWSGEDCGALDGLVSLVHEAGIAVRRSEDIRAAKWTKSLLNLSVNPLCALLSVPVGETADDHLREVIGHLIRETFAVMTAEGVRVPWATADDYLAHLFGVQIRDFSASYPSMYYDISCGRRTEIDLLNGYIAALGERHGIPTPYNACIAELIRYRQSAGAGRHIEGGGA
ncbi:ketopantoate reductase family protein [uncultured Methanofollis sp.]|uniref:ketopantoate reductase family protein n=1 Tax=uncultured Methanofollis sp. TaxID=262500 RepID=UPI0026075D4A|nr:2-dehydropantoate 2-reductase [uncultured Methanofollis sp.]